MKGGHLHETTKAWITLVQAVCSGMKLGYTGDKAEREAAAAEEEMSWAEEEESLRWRKSVRSGSNRLIDKRQAITYETQVDINNILIYCRSGRKDLWTKSIMGTEKVQ